MRSITDMVKDEFAELGQQETEAIDRLDAVAEEMSHLSEAEFSVAMAGLIKATADKKSGATVIGIVKQVVPVLLKMI